MSYTYNYKGVDDFIKQNFADEVEKAINYQIMFELKASHAYMSLVSIFSFF